MPKFSGIIEFTTMYTPISPPFPKKQEPKFYVSIPRLLVLIAKRSWFFCWSIMILKLSHF